MCGLAGLYHMDGQPVDPRQLCDMARLQAHRGPDDSGLYLFSLAGRRGVDLGRAIAPGPLPMPTERFEGGFAFNRLSIRDLSQAGHQPMVDADGTAVIVFNGEIYNADELREELRHAGAVFRSTTDTEVILSAYRQWGLDRTLERLNGMFAFAIADLATGHLWLARDRFGIKPLYWMRSGERVAFASEIKAFFALPGFDAAPDPTGFDEFLLFRYRAGAATLVTGVEQVEPGCVMEVGPTGLRRRRYWSLPARTVRVEGEGAVRAAALSSLSDAVRRQLISDVPLGTQLSGGIDSSLVASLAVEARPGRMSAYSVVLDDPALSEEAWSAEVAGRVGLEQHRILLTEAEFTGRLAEACWHMDQPLGHPNALGILSLAERARRDVTVLLSGEGADETFAGYHRYLYPQWGGRLAPLLPALTRLPKLGAAFERRFGADPRLDVPTRFILSQAALRPAVLSRLRPGAEIGAALAARRALFGGGEGALLDRCLAYDTRCSLPDLLVRQDKMTMAHGVENRVPFLDNAVVDLAWSLPPGALLTPGFGLEPAAARSTKIVLKHLAAEQFGERMAYRPKSGFGLPLRSWLPRARGLWQEVALPALRDHGVVDPRAAAALVAEPARWTAADVEAAWILLSLGVWLGTYGATGREATAATRGSVGG
ncbi:MAG: hypothetical protein RLY86_640 [Pseudomonadota bacterium]|jgi:asparagine synthase (glutamine-hydrolysing)